MAATGAEGKVSVVTEQPAVSFAELEQPAVSFAELLKRLRTDAGLTQEDLAARASVSPRAISDLERGINKTARQDTARLLADALSLSGTARAGFVTSARGYRDAEPGMLAQPRTRSRLVAATTPVLPHDIRSFTGRQADLARLMAGVKETGGVVGIYAIDGMAGVGKSAFAVHAAHVLAPRFPDGQIFLQLHAHTGGHRPVDAADALASLLLTTGVAAGQIPAALSDRSALWRSHLAGRRVLLLLDDAASHEQVEPLLPGTPGSLALITSRRHLSALDGAMSICLETLPPDEAAALLNRLADRPGLQSADPAVEEINRLCGHLPLAIGMLARQLHHHPAWSAAGLARELAAARDRLELMELMHAENLSVAAAFDLSYQDLTVGQRRLFRRLGLHPGTDIDSYAAAALDGSSLAAARRGLDELFDQHLVTEPASGRYRMHDLIREYARTLVQTDDSEDRESAIVRLTDYYVRAAAAIGRHFNRSHPAVGEAPVGVPELLTREEAAAWMEAERANMHAVVDYAAGRGWPAPGIVIATAMSGFLQTHGHWAQMWSLHVTALDTARTADYRQGEAEVLTNLGIVQRLTGDYVAAAATLARALGVCRSSGDEHGQAKALVALGIVQRLTVSYPMATATLTQALELHERVGDRLGQADALSELGCVQRLTRDHRAAQASLERALDLYRDLGDRHGQADSLRYLARVYQETGNYEIVASCYADALELYRGLDDRLGQAHTLNFLGIAQHVSDDYLTAEDTLKDALDLYRDLGHRLGQAEVLNNLGDYYAVSDPAQARADHEQALEIARSISAILEEARALEGIGNCEILETGPGYDDVYLRRALGLYQRIGSPHAARVSETLRFHGL
jgi:tetratricopeptide (TPR) repeat protein/transcriptional regulator with XRE-family HTH domain